MTALKPIENRNVRGVASERYPINTKCAHPECSEPATVHHIFPRSMIRSDSYFVAILQRNEAGDPEEEIVIPHAVGLCGSGTTGHHGDVEEHRAWIKYEDGEFVWYDRGELDWSEEEGNIVPWDRVGPLNPQPGSREGKPKRKKYKGEKRRKRKVISMRVPDDAEEDGAGQWDELIDLGREFLMRAGMLDSEEDWETYPPFNTIMAVGLKGLEAIRGEIGE